MEMVLSERQQESLSLDSKLWRTSVPRRIKYNNERFTDGFPEALTLLQGKNYRY